MEHIANMERSLLAAVNLTKLQLSQGFGIDWVYYDSEYDFLNAADYLTQVEEYILKYNTPELRRKIANHLTASDWVVNNGLIFPNTVDICLSFTKDPHRSFEGALIFRSVNGVRHFADLDYILYTGPGADLRGDVEISILGWRKDPKKNITLVNKGRDPGTKSVEFCELIDKIKWVLSGLLPLFPDEADTSKQLNRNDHFSRNSANDELLKVYNGLKAHAFLPPTTPFTHFLYVCNGHIIPDTDAPFKPLQWLSSQNDLAYFIDAFFGRANANNLWRVTKNCFRINGKIPNDASMKHSISKIRIGDVEKPRGGALKDEILS
jgi:hypothetical protein